MFINPAYSNTVYLRAIHRPLFTVGSAFATFATCCSACTHKGGRKCANVSRCYASSSIFHRNRWAHTHSYTHAICRNVFALAWLRVCESRAVHATGRRRLENCSVVLLPQNVMHILTQTNGLGTIHTPLSSSTLKHKLPRNQRQNHTRTHTHTDEHEHAHRYTRKSTQTVVSAN